MQKEVKSVFYVEKSEFYECCTQITNIFMFHAQYKMRNIIDKDINFIFVYA